MFYSLVSTQLKIPNRILSKSFLIGVLHLVGTLSLCEDIIYLADHMTFNYFDGTIIHHKIMDEDS